MTFTGENLDVAQSPRLVLNGASVSSPLSPTLYTCVSTCHLSLQSPCMVVDTTTLTCISPPMTADSGQIQYALILDNAQFPNIPDFELQLSARPDPTGFTLVVTSVSLEAETAIVRITVRNLSHAPMYVCTVHNYALSYVYTCTLSPHLLFHICIHLPTHVPLYLYRP